VDPTTSGVYRKIAVRLKMFKPEIDLAEYIKGPDPDLRREGSDPRTAEEDVRSA
jgi:hypothetical protein